MKKVITKKVAEVFSILNEAKYAKLADADKIKVWKIVRALQPVSSKYLEDVRDAEQKLMPDGDFQERLTVAQQYEVKRNNGEKVLPMTEAEYMKVVEEFKEYRTLVDKAVEDFGNKEVELDFEPLSEAAFGQLMASNEWNMAQVMGIGEVICNL